MSSKGRWNYEKKQGDNKEKIKAKYFAYNTDQQPINNIIQTYDDCSIITPRKIHIIQQISTITNSHFFIVDSATSVQLMRCIVRGADWQKCADGQIFL